MNEVLQWSDADSLERVGRRREGVALYVREFIIALLGGMGEEPMGSLWIRIKARTGRGDIIEGACYRPLDQEKVDESL